MNETIYKPVKKSSKQNYRSGSNIFFIMVRLGFNLVKVGLGFDLEFTIVFM